MSISEDQIKALTNDLKTQITDQAKEFIDEIKEADEEFFTYLAERLAKNYFELKFGDEDRKPIAKENIEALNRGLASKIAERGWDIAEHSKSQFLGVLMSIGKTVLTMALSVA